MRASKVLTLAIAASLGCVASSAAPPVTATARTGNETRPAAPVEDAHWFQPDDYLIVGGSQCGATIGKLLADASPATKGEAKFFATVAAKEVWTKTSWRTRPAAPADLQIGGQIFCSGDQVIPTSKEFSRTRQWDPGRITDTSDLYKGFVTFKTDTGCCCGETRSCPVAAARVPIP